MKATKIQCTILLILFFISYLLPSFNIKFGLLVIFYFVISVYLLITEKNIFSQFICFLIISIALTLALIFNVNDIGLPQLIYSLSYFLFMILFGKKLLDNNITSYKVFYFNFVFSIVFVFLALIYTHFSTNLPFSYYGENVFYGQSRNIVSYYLIVSSIGYIIFCRLNDIHPKVYLLFLMFILCITLIGRSGMLLAFMVLLVPLNNINIKWKVFIFVLLLPLILYFYTIFQELYLASRFSARGLDSPRTLINSEFFDALDFQSFFTGVKVSDVPTAFNFDGNPHNSFLYFNFKFGGAVLVPIFLFCLAFISSLLKKDWLSLYFLLIIFVRYNLDVVAFFGQYTDIVFFVLLYLSLSNHSLRDRKKTPNTVLTK
jgi:hypothetical protein